MCRDCKELARRNLYTFASRIIELPNKDKYVKQDLLTPSFLLERKEGISIFYAAHNDIINEKARVFIIGITPGWTQMERSIHTARRHLLSGLSIEETAQRTKHECRFFGSMRQNLISMLNELDLTSYLGIRDCDELFQSKQHLLHTTSLIKHPVFVNEKNYSGHQPNLLKEELFTHYLTCFFQQEVKALQEALIIPLGKAVEDGLKQMGIPPERCLFGFPHPSGANGHRRRQFTERQELLKAKIGEFFSG
ncbi:MAG TPA: hypothetical protein VNM45_12310 [Bacillus sp. (in: firmicutes)]|nr:hypothetical protein [Bacillus sp. (in: firmicutes)]